MENFGRSVGGDRSLDQDRFDGWSGQLYCHVKLKWDLKVNFEEDTHSWECYLNRSAENDCLDGLNVRSRTVSGFGLKTEIGVH